MKSLAIVGASGHGKVVADLAELCGYQVVFFDDAYPQKQTVEHWPVVGTFNDLLSSEVTNKNVIVGIGDNRIRDELTSRLINDGFKLPVLIHPSAVVSKYVKIGAGSVVFANAVINAFAQVGQNSIINTGALVEHDCILGKSVHLSPYVALAGGTKIGCLSWLGIGSVTKQLIEIGECTIIGANSTVIKNIPSNVVAIGSPAVIKKYQ